LLGANVIWEEEKLRPDRDSSPEPS